MASRRPARDEEEEEDEEDDDEGEDVAFAAPAAKSRQRASVSAEAFGNWNKRNAFEPPVYPKTLEQVSELTSILARSFLFSELDPKDVQVVVFAMKGPLVLQPGTQIITEGHPGDHLYVVTGGTLDCRKILGGVDTVVKTCVQGDLFGELALLYNAPRAASVMSREVSTVWELDRETFTSIVMEAVQRKRSQCTAVLRRVPLLAAMSDGEVENIIDALRMEAHPQGTMIIEQGAYGNDFFIVYEGQAVATKANLGSPEPATFVHQAGDYFGELALLHDEPRAATVVAATQVRLLAMDRATFKRLMGPAEDFLHRGVARYT